MRGIIICEVTDSTGSDRLMKQKQNIVEFLKNHIRLPYYFVPPCPVCGSERTGRYVKFHSTVSDEYTTKMSLKNGELTQFTDRIDPEKTFFCVDCGAEWSEYAGVRWLSINEINEEKKKRATDSLLNNFIANEKEEKKKDKKTGISGLIRGFIGHI